jgi:ectoine hydroxylase-related dioxygenase (phytanoyl-CoA dioxygenase family)
MNQEPLRDITEAEVRTYRQDGVVVLKGMFDMDWVERLHDLAEADLQTPSEMQQELSKDGDSGRFFNNTFLWPRNGDFKDIVYHSPAAKIAGRLMEARKLNIVFDQLLIKEPGTSERTIWHHDLTYWPISGNRVCTLWLALDSVTAESGAVEYVKGSHLWGKRYKAEAFTGDGRYEEDLPPMPDIEAMRGELDFIQYELEPGDCTVHHGLIVHGAPGNATADRRRRAYLTRWAGDNVTYQPRPNIQPMLWDPDVPPGKPLDSELWPVVWRDG